MQASHVKAAKAANEIRVIAPSYYWEPGFEERDNRAKERLENLGYKVSFGEHLASHYHLGTARAEDRVADFHEAVSDENVKIIMAYSGGWSANEMLPLIDWNLVQANPKLLIGYSDIAALLNAIYAKTGNISLLGPDYGALGNETEWKYTLDHLSLVLRQKYPMKLTSSKAWSSKDGETRHQSRWSIMQEGNAEGILIGGNFNTFHLLQGTQFQPIFDRPFVLVAEDDDESGERTTRYFSRRLESILQIPGVRKNLTAIIVGRFLPKSKVTAEDLASVIASKNVGNIPVISNMDFGHTLPNLTLPIGGRMKISVKENDIEIIVTSA
jgi:muramoyltetrapeptide carboxypeptidase LdcA involved in peptidoglycan recycling